MQNRVCIRLRAVLGLKKGVQKRNDYCMALADGIRSHPAFDRKSFTAPFETNTSGGGEGVRKTVETISVIRRRKAKYKIVPKSEAIGVGLTVFVLEAPRTERTDRNLS